MNRLMSGGMDGRWRTFTAGVSGVVAGDAVIDVCCGTGDLSLSLLDRVSSRGRVVGLDFADEMLDVARTKSSIVEWMQGDALDLPFDDDRVCRRDHGIWHAQPARLRPWVYRDGPGGQARRPGGVPGADRAASARWRRSRACGPTGWCRCWAGLWPTTAMPTRICRSRCTAFPRAEELAEIMRGGGASARPVQAAQYGCDRRARRYGGRVSAVARVLAVEGASAYVAAVEARLSAEVASGGGLVAETGAQTLRAGGKRLRPMLTYLCAPIAGRDRPQLVIAGCAVELVHMATLVHDDQLDRAPLRRGIATVWHEHGPAIASATGDYLFARAFAELVQTGDMTAVSMLSDACHALARGEILQREQAGDPSITPERLSGALPPQDRRAVLGRGPAGWSLWRVDRCRTGAAG